MNERMNEWINEIIEWTTESNKLSLSIFPPEWSWSLFKVYIFSKIVEGMQSFVN